MDKENLKNLLTDLYNKYNPAHLVHVDELAERYKDSPYSAIDMIFLKYNHRNLPHYDPNKSKEQYKIDLLKIYESGGRAFQNVDLAADALETSEPEQKKIENRKEQQVLLSEQRMSDIANDVVSSNQKKRDEAIEYTVTVDGAGENLQLPSSRFLASMAPNTRVILRAESGKIMGFIVKDVTYDFFSLDSKVLAMIHLQRE
jgi:hypothetical protein